MLAMLLDLQIGGSWTHLELCRHRDYAEGLGCRLSLA
jgi:hypothetical protein